MSTLKSPESTQFLDLRVTHIEQGFEDLKTITKHTNDRVDQIYEHLISREQSSSTQRTSWRQWGGATVLSIIALAVTLWEKVMSQT